MEDALLSCLACESLIVHGTEKSHPVPIKAAKRAGLVHGAGVSDPPAHRGDGHGVQPVLVAEVVPLATHGDEPREPAVESQLVRLLVYGVPGEGQMARNGKRSSPSAAS